MKIKYLSPFIAIAFLQIPYLAQSPPKKQPVEQQAFGVYSNAEIQISLEQLPERYRGVDPEVLYKLLDERTKQVEKDEFETSEAFERRRAAVRQAAIVGNLTERSLFAFMLAGGGTSSVLDKVRSVYNADRGEMETSIEIATPVVGVTIDSTRRAATLKHVMQPSTSYIGQNAYGAKVEIEKQFTYIYEIIIDNFHLFPFDLSSYRTTLPVTIKIDSASARAAKPSIRVLALSSIARPNLLRGFLSHKPTVTEPKDSLMAFQHLIVVVQEFWVYNYETGQIYVKIKPGMKTEDLNPPQKGRNPVIP